MRDMYGVYRAPEARQLLTNFASPFGIAVSYNSSLHEKIATALNIIMTEYPDKRAPLQVLEEELLVD